MIIGTGVAAPLGYGLRGLALSLIWGLVVASASAGGSSGPAVVSRVQIEVSLPNGLPSESERSRAVNRLIDRLMAFAGPTSAQPGSPLATATAQGMTGAAAGHSLDGTYVDVFGLNCDEALRFVEAAVLDQYAIEVGLVGSPPVVRSWDVAQASRTQEGQLNLLLRNEGAKRLRDLTTNHIGGSAYFRFVGSGSEVAIPIVAVIDSGRLQVEAENVPDDFARQPIFGYPAKATGCSESSNR